MASVGADHQIVEFDMAALDVVLHPENGVHHGQVCNFHIFTRPEPDDTGLGLVDLYIVGRVKGTASVDESFTFDGDILFLKGKKQCPDPFPSLVEGNGGGEVKGIILFSSGTVKGGVEFKLQCQVAAQCECA